MDDEPIDYNTLTGEALETAVALGHANRCKFKRDSRIEVPPWYELIYRHGVKLVRKQKRGGNIERTPEIWQAAMPPIKECDANSFEVGPFMGSTPEEAVLRCYAACWAVVPDEPEEPPPPEPVELPDAPAVP